MFSEYAPLHCTMVSATPRYQSDLGPAAKRFVFDLPEPARLRWRRGADLPKVLTIPSCNRCSWNNSVLMSECRVRRSNPSTRA